MLETPALGWLGLRLIRYLGDQLLCRSRWRSILRVFVSFDAVMVGCRKVGKSSDMSGVGLVCEGSGFDPFEGWGTVASWRGWVP